MNMPEPFLPTTNPRILKMILKAAKRNRKLDKVEEDLGTTPVPLQPISSQLRTAICALIAGMSQKSWDEVAEALVMISQAEILTRQLEAKVEIVLKAADPRRN